MNLDFFNDIAKENNLNIVYLNHVGKINNGLFVGNRFLLKTGYLIQEFLDFMYFKLNIKFKDNKLFSPYIIGIFKIK